MRWTIGIHILIIGLLVTGAAWFNVVSVNAAMAADSPAADRAADVVVLAVLSLAALAIGGGMLVGLRYGRWVLLEACDVAGLVMSGALASTRMDTLGIQGTAFCVALSAMFLAACFLIYRVTRSRTNLRELMLRASAGPSRPSPAARTPAPPCPAIPPGRRAPGPLESTRLGTMCKPTRHR